MESLYLTFMPQVVQVGHPVVVRVQLVGQVLVAAVGGLGRGVRAVGGRGADDAGLAAQEAVHLGHGVADAVEEDDVVGRDLRAAAAVDLLGQELARGGHAGRVAVGPGRRPASTSSCTISRIHGAIFSPFCTGSPMFSQVIVHAQVARTCSRPATISRIA